MFSNDIVCLAVAPVLVEACLRRGLDPVPFLLGAGLRGEHRLGRHADRQPAEHADRRRRCGCRFAGYPAEALAAGRRSACVVAVGAASPGASRGRWRRDGADAARRAVRRRAPPLDRWQTVEGAGGGRPCWSSVFLFTAVAARGGRAGRRRRCCSLSRKLHSHDDAGPGRLGTAGALHRPVRGQPRRWQRPGCAAQAVAGAGGRRASHLDDSRLRSSRATAGAVEPRVQRAGGHAAAAARRRHPLAGPLLALVEHARRQPADRRLASPTSSSVDAGARAVACRIDWRAPRRRRHPGDASDARSGGRIPRSAPLLSSACLPHHGL
ncbi:MAG: hypothetical protein MZV65_48745 [Chromatiales bacterium]|nr:hypothetical protein [Chromatiales bacterium]